MEYKYVLCIYSELAEKYPEISDDFKCLRLLYEHGLDKDDQFYEHVNNIIKVGEEYLRLNLEKCDSNFKTIKLKRLNVGTYVVVDVLILSDSTLNEEDYIEQLIEQIDDFGISGVFG